MTKLFDKKEIMNLFKAKSYLETNISELFFTEKFAFKIKKSVERLREISPFKLNSGGQKNER